MRPLSPYSPLLFSALCAAGLSAAEPEPEPNARTTAYQTSVSQEQLRGNTRRLEQEMVGLFGEFSEYQSAAPELARLKETFQQLDVSVQSEMLGVIKTLREASRAGEPEGVRNGIVQASGEQKSIEEVLRKLADRLTLQKDAAAVQQRIKDLAVRQAKNVQKLNQLAASNPDPQKLPWEQKNTQALAKTEQEALRNEVKMAAETLRKLAEHPEVMPNETFKQAAETAQKQNLEAQAVQAAEKTATDLTNAAQAAKAVSEGLKTMLQDLQKNQSAAEQAEAMAQELKEMAQEENRMAKKAAHATAGAESEVRKAQQDLSAKLEVAQKSVEKLNADAARQTADARTQTDQLTDALKNNAFNKVDNVAKASDAQSAVAEKLNAASDLLHKTAEALAANEPQSASPAGEQSDEAPSAAEAAVANAVQQVLAAKTDLTLGQRQAMNGDQNEAKRRLEDAQNLLQKAEESAAQAGAAVDKSVGENLDKAKASAAKAEQGVGVGSHEDQERSGWNADRAQESASRALDGLKQAANQLAASAAAEKAGRLAGQQPGKDGKNGKQPGKGQGEAKSSQGSEGGPTGMSKAGKQETDFSAVAKLQAGQREALSLLKTEKAPSEYETMVEQYVRNLAESDSGTP